MSYHGDITLGDTIDIKFTSRRFSTGAPHTLSGGDVAAYVGNGTTEITAGITLTADFDSRTGLNNVRVVASGGNGFAAATNVTLVLTAGSVDSVSVAGEAIGSFSIQNRYGAAPTAAAVADAVWDEPQAGHVTAGTFGSYLDLQLTSGLADYVQPTHTIIADKLDAMLELDGAVYRFTANALEQAPTGGGGPTAADIADAVWDEDATAHQTQGTFGQVLGDSGSTATSVWSRVTTALPNAAPAGNGGLLLLGTTNTIGIVIATATGNGLDITCAENGSSCINLGHTSVVAGTGINIGITEGRGINVSSTDDALRLLDNNGGSGINSNSLDLIERISTGMFMIDSGVTYGDAVAGSVVKEITDNVTASVDVDEAAIATAVLETLVPGSFASGSVGHTIGMLSGVTVTVVSPVASDLDITLVRGDAYTARLGRALTFLDTDDTWPDLTDGVVTLEVGDGELTVTGIVVTATGTGKSVRVEPLSSQTEELTEERYDYNLVVTFPGTGTTLTDGGDRMTLASGTMHVVDREDA